MRAHASPEHLDWGLLAKKNTKKLQYQIKEHGFDGIIIGSMNNRIWLTGIPMTADFPYFFTHEHTALDRNLSLYDIGIGRFQPAICHLDAEILLSRGAQRD